MYKANDVCIVGRGGIYADTWSADEFVDNVFAGRCFIEDLRKKSHESYPFRVSEVYNADPKAEDQSYSPYGSNINRTDLRERFEKKFRNWQDLTTLDAVTLAACDEAFAPIRHLPQFKTAEIILGIASPDTESSFFLAGDVAAEILQTARDLGIEGERYDRIEEQIRSVTSTHPQKKSRLPYVVVASVLRRIKDEFGIEGPACITDAACASSLAALYLSIKKLRQGEADLVISGGADLSVSSGCLVYFSRLGAMSPEITAPFDERAAGLSQGEGAGIFALMRLQDALDNGLKVCGVVKACEGSSDGKSSAIVEPTPKGQLLAYQKAYARSGITEVDYVEAHGTGTRVGDRTEITSLSEQFPKKKFPIGSVKANYGHTIGAAGAAGLLKCLGVLDRRAVPPSTHFRKFPSDLRTNLFVPKDLYSLPNLKRPLTLGLSSFGFGGSNYHAVVQEFSQDVPVLPETEEPSSPVVICGSEFYSFKNLDVLSAQSQYRVPPKTLPHIEETQLLAIYGLEDLFRKLNVVPALLDRDRVSVFAASMMPLEGFWRAGRRVATGAFKRHLLPEGANDQPELAQIFEKVLSRKLKITEDTLPGYLSNVVAGRICNAFDFKGASFNLDADVASSAATFRMAKTILERDHGMVIIISADEVILEEKQEIRRNGLRVSILASAAYALEHDLPIEQVFKAAHYTNESTAAREA